MEAPGIPAYSHDYSKFVVPVDKWPSPGDLLPVEVDPGDPRRVEVLWDELPTVRDAARQEAEQMAALLRQQQQAPPAGAPGQPTVGGAGAGAQDVAGIVGQLQQMFPGAVVNVEGDPAVGGAAPPTFPMAPGQPPAGPAGPAGPSAPVHVVADQSDADPVERLEKLARLRDAGIVDQTQFEQLKAQILEQAGLDTP